MKNLLLKTKGLLGSAWNRILDHYLCVCAILITSICFMGYNLKVRADYEKVLSSLTNDHIEAIGLIQDQNESLMLTEDAIERQGNALREQGQFINKLVNLLNEQKATIEYQNRIIEELVKRLRDNGLLPKAPNRSDANWILHEPKNTQ